MSQEQQKLHAELAGLCAAAAYLREAGQADHEAAVRAVIARYAHDYAEQLGSPITPFSSD